MKTYYCEGVRKIESKVDYLIGDMTLMLGNDSHMGIDDALELIKEYPNIYFAIKDSKFNL